MAKTDGSDMVGKTSKKGSVKDLIMSPDNKARIEAALPQTLDTDRFLRVYLLAITQNRQLATCTGESLLASMLKGAMLGLEVGVLEQAYLVPISGKAEFWIGYKGLIDLCRRSGDLLSIAARVVRENDEFSITLGENEHIEHKIDIRKDRGKPIAYYAVGKTKDGGVYVTEPMSQADMQAFRKQYVRSSQKDTPWNTAFEEQSKKTMIRRLIKLMPMSIESQDAISTASTDERNVTPMMEVDVQEPEPEPEDEPPKAEEPKRDSQGDVPKGRKIDAETGEITTEEAGDEPDELDIF